MKFLPVLVHTIRLILRSGGKSDLTSDDLQRSMTLNYANIDVRRHFGNNKRGSDVLNIYFCYNGVVLIFQRALAIIKRLLPLTSGDCERSMTSKYQNIHLASLVNDKYGYHVLKHSFMSQWNSLNIPQSIVDYHQGFTADL